ncbi:Transcription factor bHLH94 [Spatholobus suberectus]|nr:Transcription factor bHLH94 [Spatholobus suberectus]
MALGVMVFPQDPFTCSCKDYFYSSVGGGSHDYGITTTTNNNIDHTLHANWDSSSPSVLQNVKEQWDSHSSPEACIVDQSLPRAFPPPPSSTEATTSHRKRRHTKSKEGIENQRMTHIAVECN